jgi:uncharacterized UPF0160 family protein
MKMLSLIALLLSLSWTVHADGWRHGSTNRDRGEYSFWQEVEDRRYVQQERISVATDNGQLTRREVKRLNGEVRNVSKLIRKYKRLRYLESSEKREVMDCLNIVSEKIRKLTFNRHTAYRQHNKHQKQNHDEREERRRVVSWRDFPHPGDLFFRF